MSLLFYELGLHNLKPGIDTLKQGLAYFETVGMPARNLAVRTREEYSEDLADLIEFLTQAGVTQLKGANLRDLENYQAEMDRRGYRASTRERKTYTIKSFFKFLHRHGLIATNVASQLIPPPRRRAEPRFLSEEEYQRLLSACSHNPRDKAIIELLLQTGINLSELARLTLYDVELPQKINRDPHNTGTLRVTRKDTVENVPLNFKACQALAEWLKVRPKVDDVRLFVTKLKTPMSKRAIQYTVNKYLEAAEIKDASVRTLRHTMGAHYLAKGGDLKAVQKMLGHESLETTRIYQTLAKKAQRRMVQDLAL